MKRITFKPAVLLSALFLIPAVAAAAVTEMSAKDAAGLGLKLKFVGDSLQVEGSNIPLVCVQNLSLELKSEPVENGKEKLKAATSIEDNDLKNYVTKIVPVFKFTSVPATKEKAEIRNFAECLSSAKDLEKADLNGKDKISKDIDQPKEAAYVEFGSELLKNPAYVKLENDVKRINCKENCNDTPEKLMATLKSVDRSSLAGIVAKLESSVDDLLLEFVSAVDSAKSEADLEIVRAGLVKFSKDIEAGSLSDDTKKDLQSKAGILLVQGIPAKELRLCQEEVNAASFSAFGWSGFSASTPSSASTDLWSKFRSPKETAKATTVSTASRCVAFMAKSIDTAAGLPRQDAATKKENLELKKLLLTKGSDARIEMIGQIDAKDTEMREALMGANIQMQAAQNQLAAHCGRIQNEYQFTQCGILKDRYTKYGNFIQTYGQRFQAAQTQDQLVYNSHGGASYSNSQASTNNPFALNPAVFPEAARWNAQSGMNYQNSTFDPSLMYKPQSDWNRMSVDSRASATLPVAIPLNANGVPSQSMQTLKFQS